MDYTLTNKTISLPGANSKYYLILFIIWPFLAFITALFNYSKKEARNVVYLFLVYYGFSFVIANPYMDAARYALAFQENASLPFSEFFRVVGGLYTSNTSMDIVEPLISFTLSRFTSHSSVLFAGYAAIFGFFYLGSINYLYSRYQKNPGWDGIIFLLFFIFLCPITNINGFRMWTAAWIFFYASYHVVLYRNTKFIFLALFSSLVHFSFLAANAVLLLYFFLGNRNYIYIPLVLISFVLPQLIAPVFRSLAFRMGGGIQDRYEGYSSEGYITALQQSREQASWFMQIGNSMLFYFLILAIVYIKIYSGSLMKNEPEKNLFSFVLLLLAFVNFGRAVPSFGGRFQMVFWMFATFYVFLYSAKLSPGRIHFHTLVGLFPMLLFTAITFRNASASINAWLFSPGLGIPFLASGVSVAHLLFGG